MHILHHVLKKIFPLQQLDDQDIASSKRDLGCQSLHLETKTIHAFDQRITPDASLARTAWIFFMSPFRHCWTCAKKLHRSTTSSTSFKEQPFEFESSKYTLTPTEMPEIAGGDANKDLVWKRYDAVVCFQLFEGRASTGVYNYAWLTFDSLHVAWPAGSIYILYLEIYINIYIFREREMWLCLNM